MDCQKSPREPSPAQPISPPELDSLHDDPMAAVVAPSVFNAPPTDPRNASAASSGVGKTRYRPAPAKTFQCRGYGECRMVFSRSEHLARHIRKHTGERPFTCHCSKQFSRLDNLRQHAQTVHADKQDQNERMMQELTSLHANMTAAAKGGSSRAKRAGTGSNPAGGSPTNNAALNGSIPTMAVKTEDGSHAVLPMSQRPGTSTGYEGANTFLQPGSSAWHIQTSDVDRPNQRPTNSHSFRDPGQSFRAPASASSASPTSPPSLNQHQLQHHAGQSFLVPSASTFNFSVPDIPSAARPGSSSGSSAATGSAPESARSLPPLSAVVASSLSPVRALPPPPGSSPLAPLSAPSQQQQPLTHSSVLPPPTPTGPYFGQRPSTAELEQYQAWARLGGQSYPYGLPSELDASAAGSSPYADSAAAMEAAARMQEEQTNRRLPEDTTPRFPSTHPQRAGQRRTPPNPQQQLSATHMSRQTLANDLTLDPTTMTAHVSAANGSAEMHLAAQLAAAGATTTTGQSLGPSLDGSPSWNSAMTHLQMRQQLDHLYRYQQQQQHQAVRQQQQQQQVHSRGPPHHPDSSRPPRNSHSSIGPVSAPLRQQLAQNPHLAAQAHHYSLELHRQQEEQLRQRLQAHEETAERERRNSAEEYLMRQQQQFAAVYGSAGAGGPPLSGSPHPMGAAAAAYFPDTTNNSSSFQDGLSRGRHPSHPRPQGLHAHSGAHHHPLHLQVQVQGHAHLAHQAILDGGYPLPDGVGPDPLELGVLGGPGGSPAGMIRYESPLPLE
ncbi:transcription factor [Ganoderma sinense ZZ0214-1]|uniref:Transcription factor n=1 Tax=Ganoderma sinense ZZ0214-1 TaxID=1077348 RepID=A0A2G8SI10_9APHY|nr:transcription factor [Ganoderma sinense ZZ0214-1]